MMNPTTPEPMVTKEQAITATIACLTVLIATTDFRQTDFPGFLTGLATGLAAGAAVGLSAVAYTVLTAPAEPDYSGLFSMREKDLYPKAIPMAANNPEDQARFLAETPGNDGQIAETPCVIC